MRRLLKNSKFVNSSIKNPISSKFNIISIIELLSSGKKILLIKIRERKADWREKM